MAARSRPGRILAKEDVDAHEEKNLWHKVATEIKNMAVQSEKVEELAYRILQEESKLFADDTHPPSTELEYLRSLYDEHGQLAETETSQLQQILEQNDLLIALRIATEGGDRAVENKRNKKRKGEELEAGNNRSKIARSNSAAPGTNGDSGDSSYGRNGKDLESLLQLKSEVAYRLPKQKGAEGEWIQCIIVKILGEGGKRRYEVQDPEPDEAGGHGQIYKASASNLIPIPKESTGLPPYPSGKQVLARYPETTTFYKAEVIATNKREGTCRLRFEGEEEVGKEQEVERRLVLDFGGK